MKKRGEVGPRFFMSGCFVPPRVEKPLFYAYLSDCHPR